MDQAVVQAQPRLLLGLDLLRAGELLQAAWLGLGLRLGLGLGLELGLGLGLGLELGLGSGEG